VTEVGRGPSELERLARHWDALAAEASELAGAHRAVHERLVRRRAKATYALDYEPLLKRAAVIEALAAELVARDVAHFKRSAPWRLIARTLKISLSAAHLRYEVKGISAFEKATTWARNPSMSKAGKSTPRPS